MGILAKSQAVIRWPQSGKVPLHGWFNVYKDNKDGNVIYSGRINPSNIPAWPDGENWGGFGMGLFGAGMFGFGTVALRFGRYRFGMGRFGFGAAMLEYKTPLLKDGTWKFGVVGFDAAGNPAGAAGTEVQATLAGTPKPPGVPQATAYDDVTEKLTLSYALSADDEG